MTVAVTVDQLTKRFEAFEALSRVSLSIGAGELVAMLGPSGSGKTTLLRIIAGLDRPDEGRILFGEVDATRLSLRERRIGFVFQSYALFRHMRVADNIAFGLRALPRRARPPGGEIRRRVGELLDLVQLAGLERRFPAQLSGGQRQRVALARALAIEPRLLLLDEPFGALDAQVRKELRRWLREVHGRTGLTTLFVTHDQDEALELADRVAVLHGGRIEQVGPPDEIYERPATPFMCRFIGEMNEAPVLIASGQAFFAGQAVGAAAGAPDGSGAIFVRPRDVLLSTPDAGMARGAVVTLRRTASTRRAEVRIEGVAAPLEADVPADVTLEPGQAVGVTLRRGRVFGGG